MIKYNDERYKQVGTSDNGTHNKCGNVNFIHSRKFYNIEYVFHFRYKHYKLRFKRFKVNTQVTQSTTSKTI